mmetsp:Transcript_28888/g.81348  ORF Transcript_28888/g.81348 Transcript_28888/m.81348 type:complete len:391 (+) Transcript_28888:184-1356(+)
MVDLAGFPSMSNIHPSPSNGALTSIPAQLPALTQSMVRQVKRDDQIIEPTDLIPLKHLGKGAYASVDLCRLAPSGRKVAVKRLHPELVDNSHDLRDFISECAILRKLRHPHLVEFLGVGSSEMGTPEKELKSLYLVQEYVPDGSLRDLLLQSSVSMGQLYSYSEGLTICRDIASALAYLHSLSPRKILHRDLKPANILLQRTSVGEGRQKVKTWHAKIADLGLAKVIEQKERSQRLETVKSGISDGLHQAGTKDLSGTGHTGSPLYMAPEVFKPQSSEDAVSTFVYDETADVFSLSLIILEVFKRQPREAFMQTEAQVNAYSAKMADGWRPELPDRWPAELRTLIEECWHQDPSRRPSAAHVRHRLEEIRPSILKMESKKGLASWFCMSS